jgi:hypothetical protein
MLASLTGRIITITPVVSITGAEVVVIGLVVIVPV